MMRLDAQWAESIEEYNDTYFKTQDICFVLNKFVKAISWRVHDAVIKNPFIEQHDISNYLLSFMIETSLLSKSKEEICDMVNKFFLGVWKDELRVLWLKLGVTPDDKEHLIDRLVMLRKISELENKLEGEKS